METKFTCASKKDNKKVTLRLSQLTDNPYDDGVHRSLLSKDSDLIVTIQSKTKTVDVLFKPNRFDKIGAVTVATNAWPRELRLPKVGKSVSYSVVGVRYV